MYEVVKVPTDTPADLHLWYCGPWCTECCSLGPLYCRHVRQPGLHTRCPETRVEGLKYSSSMSSWYVGTPFGSRIRISGAHAADLLVMGVVRPLPVELSAFWFEVIAELPRDITLPEADCHRTAQG